MSPRPAIRVFLSASVPLPSRDPSYFLTADVLAIRDCIRALAIAIAEEDAELVFGGHPAITPMIRLQVAQAGATVPDRFTLFQSRYFSGEFPSENARFERVRLVDAVAGNRAASLLAMRRAMLDRPFDVGLFIGGMEGVEVEHALFREMQPGVPALPVASTGAAAAEIYARDGDLQSERPELQDEISYLSLMRDIVRGGRDPGITPSRG